MATSPTLHMPHRTASTHSDDAVVPGEDTSEVARLFHERLQAYKHACRYLEDYIKSTEKMQQVHSKEYEKVLKTVNQPLKEGDMFDRNLGGIAEMFDNIRTNTLAISNSHTEMAKSLDQGVLPLFKRLHAEIKNKQSELAKGVGKSAKAVDKARADTAKHVERLGTASSSYESVIGKADPSNDPYVLQRGIMYRLNKQILEENAARQDLIAVQDSFSQFESHVVQSFQTGLGSFIQALNQQAEQQKGFYGNMMEKAQAIDPLFEWNGFVQRNAGVLVDPNAPPRTLQGSTFPNKDHRSTQPVCQGSLERKGMLRKFSSSFYVVTPARFMHEFSSVDDINKDPDPGMSLYLPDCSIGGLNGNLFTVKGKDISGTISKLGQSKEYEFRARTAEDAETWWGNIRGMAGKMPSSEPSSPLVPVDRSPSQRVASNTSQTPASPVAESPSSPIAAHQQTEVPGTATAATTAAPAPAPAPAPVAAPAPESAAISTAAPVSDAAHVVPASSASAEAAKVHAAATDVN